MENVRGKSSDRTVPYLYFFRPVLIGSLWSIAFDGVIDYLVNSSGYGEALWVGSDAVGGGRSTCT